MNIQVLDLRTGAVKWQRHDSVHQVALAGNSKVVISVPGLPTLSLTVFNIQSNSREEIRPPPNERGDARLSSAGRIAWLYASRSGFEIDVWDITNRARLFETALPTLPSNLSSSFERGGWRSGDDLEIWDLRNNLPDAKISHITGILNFRISPSGNLVVVLTTKDLRVYQAQGAVLKRAYNSIDTQAANVSPTDTYLGVTNYSGSFIYRLDTPPPPKTAGWTALLAYLRSNTRACLSVDDRKKFLAESDSDAQSAYHQCMIAEGFGNSPVNPPPAANAPPALNPPPNARPTRN